MKNSFFTTYLGYKFNTQVPVLYVTAEIPEFLVKQHRPSCYRTLVIVLYKTRKAGNFGSNVKYGYLRVVPCTYPK